MGGLGLTTVVTWPISHALVRRPDGRIIDEWSSVKVLPAPELQMCYRIADELTE
jgi:hypothetical protein